MAGRSSQADNRGANLFGLLASGKIKAYHTYKDAPYTSPIGPTGMTATGGVISDYTDPGPGDKYRAHVFTTSGTFTVTDETSAFGTNIEYLVVAGGGGSGGSAYAGGGGAGGFRTNVPGHPLASPDTLSVSATPGSYTVTVGGGGARQMGFGPGVNGASGTNSAFVSPLSPQTVTSYGGGRGGAYASPTPGVPGGSGGGGSANDGTKGYGYNPTTPTSVITAVPLPDPYGLTQGNPGGDGSGSGGAGGGGAGGAGQPRGDGGAGGAGSPISISGSDVTYAAGGLGATPADRDGTDGTYSTGNGGGANGSAGGSGIVIIKYQIGNSQRLKLDQTSQ